jgi:hypothetical protein
MLDLDGGGACWIVGILLEKRDMWLWCLKKCLKEESDLCWWVLFIEVLKRSKKICPYGLCCNQMKRKNKLKTRISKKNGVSQEALIPYGSSLIIEKVRREREEETLRKG